MAQQQPERLTMEDVGNYLSIKESRCRQQAEVYRRAGKEVTALAWTAAAEAYADALIVISHAIDAPNR